MATPVRPGRTRGSIAGRDLAAGQAVLLAVLALTLVALLELAVSDHLGLLFGVTFVLVAWTVPLTVHRGAFFTAGVLPPLLMVAELVVFAVLAPDALHTDGLAADAGFLERLFAGLIAQATALIVGHLGALALIAFRVASAPDPAHPEAS